MAKAVGNTGRHQLQEKQVDTEVLRELASKLEELGKAQEAARHAAFGDEPEAAVAYQQLFIAVALLNPLQAAAKIHNMMP